MSSSSLIDPVVDHLADLALWEAELAAGPGAVDPLSVASPLVERLRRVPDPRRLRGLRHPLLVILVLTACATLVAGNDGVTAIRQWAARTPQDVLHRLGARRNPCTGRYLVPSERTGGSWPPSTVTLWTRRCAATPLTWCAVTPRSRRSRPPRTSRSSENSAGP